MFRISNKTKELSFLLLIRNKKSIKIKQKQSLGLYQTSDTERNLIGRRTQSDRAADGIQSDCVRVTVRKA